MALYEKKWWKRIFQKTEKKSHLDSLKDIEAISEFLQNINPDVQEILKLLSELDELEKEREVAKPGILQINLETQAEIVDKLLEHYEYLQNDVDINGLRLKLIARELLHKADKAGLKDLFKEKKDHWKF